MTLQSEDTVCFCSEVFLLCFFFMNNKKSGAACISVGVAREWKPTDC